MFGTSVRTPPPSASRWRIARNRYAPACIGVDASESSMNHQSQQIGGGRPPVATTDHVVFRLFRVAPRTVKPVADLFSANPFTHYFNHSWRIHCYTISWMKEGIHLVLRRLTNMVSATWPHKPSPELFHCLEDFNEVFNHVCSLQSRNLLPKTHYHHRFFISLDIRQNVTRWLISS